LPDIGVNLTAAIISTFALALVPDYDRGIQKAGNEQVISVVHPRARIILLQHFFFMGS